MSLIARRYFQAFTGITMIGIGVAFNYMANLGLGPWGVLHDGISKTISITYGQAGILTSLLALLLWICLLYTSPSPRDKRQSRMPSSA